MNDSIRFYHAAQHFANKVENLASVQEVILCGSMADGDPYPGDLDLAVVLSHLDELPDLARFCRQISSATHAWEVFVFNANINDRREATMSKYMEQLNSEQAKEVLRILCKGEAKLASRAEEIAKAFICDIQEDELASQVYWALEHIDVRDLWDRSGKTRFGYVDPVEKAYEMVKDALEPFAEQIHKLRDLALLSEAKKAGLGLTKGVIQFSKEGRTEFSEWAQDDPIEWLWGWLTDWEKECANEEEQACIREMERLLEERHL
ncbi:hypothetical protein PaeBR_17625 [Paenibacillus sp. BR2-3]|uniref:hypothetical protein n=1 Tax=Paenibacillus sp. BR2-3 TaxID=3048494 RepID=UPI003977DE0A